MSPFRYEEISPGAASSAAAGATESAAISPAAAAAAAAAQTLCSITSQLIASQINMQPSQNPKRKSRLTHYQMRINGMEGTVQVANESNRQSLCCRKYASS
jgi:hypothetical protein